MRDGSAVPPAQRIYHRRPWAQLRVSGGLPLTGAAASQAARGPGPPGSRRRRRFRADGRARARARNARHRAAVAADESTYTYISMCISGSGSGHEPAIPCRATGPLREREDLVSAVGYQDRVLELGGAAAVLGDHGPAVRPDVVVDRAEGQHRLDGERHPRLHDGGGAGVVEVRDHQARVEGGADAVACEVADHAVAEPPGVGLDDPAYHV